jgi:photosystem II stability/assembly factor-like uncharacterized protein
MRFYISTFLSLSYGLIVAQNATLTSASLNKVEARCIGPAVMGGRITAIDGVENDPRILYVGCAGGGIWKTTNGGSEFKSIFDKHCQSIGAIAINQKNPEEVWVGTGESNMRNTVSVGNGVYKTTDGGENWTFMGLPNSEHISKVVIHPQNPNTVYVAVVGKLWGNSSERGLYKTTDGGKNWQRILFVNDSTGCADFIMNPSQSGHPLRQYVAGKKKAVCLRQWRSGQCYYEINRWWGNMEENSKRITGRRYWTCSIGHCAFFAR